MWTILNRQGMKNYSNKMDWVTVALYCAIVFWGWLNIYAVTYDPESEISIFNLNINSGRQLLFIAGACRNRHDNPDNGYAIL